MEEKKIRLARNVSKKVQGFTYQGKEIQIPPGGTINVEVVTSRKGGLHPDFAIVAEQDAYVPPIGGAPPAPPKNYVPKYPFERQPIGEAKKAMEAALAKAPPEAGGVSPKPGLSVAKAETAVVDKPPQSARENLRKDGEVTLKATSESLDATEKKQAKVQRRKGSAK